VNITVTFAYKSKDFQRTVVSFFKDHVVIIVFSRTFKALKTRKKSRIFSGYTDRSL